MRRFFSGLWRGVTAPFRAVHHFLTDDPGDRPLIDTFSDAVQHEEARTSILDHINALRGHLLRSILYVFVGAMASLFFAEDMLHFLADMAGGMDALQAIKMTEPISVFMQVGFLAGFILAVPFITFEVWLFVAPALRPRARRLSLVFIPLAGIFFVSGVYVSYRLLLPRFIHFMLNFMIQVKPTLASYYSDVTQLLFWMGITFEFPLVAFVLTSARIIHPRMLIKQVRYALVVIALLAAIITPTSDILSMLWMMLPMTVLYLLGILMSYLALPLRRRKKEEQPA